MAVIDLTEENFDLLLDQHPIMLVDFWATWCQPCLEFSKIFEVISEKYPTCLFGKVNVDTEKQLAADFAVRSIPTLLIIRDHVVVYSGTGTMPASVLEDLIKKALNLDMNSVKPNENQKF